MATELTPALQQEWREAAEWARPRCYENALGMNLADRLIDALDALAAAEKRATDAESRVEACICDTSPSTDGPEETCPRHGRPHGYWVARGDALAERNTAARNHIATQQAAIQRSLDHDLWHAGLDKERALLSSIYDLLVGPPSAAGAKD